MEAPHGGLTGYISTGIPGLDHILGGGFLREGFYLLQGDPGSGKTTLALQYLMTCGRLGERGLYITLTETRRDLELACRSHGWSLDNIEVSDLTRSEFNVGGVSEYIVFHPSEVELGETTRHILDEVERTRPRHVVFDGLSELRLLAADPLRYRRQLLALKQIFAERHTTVLLLDDRTNPMGEIQPESLVGGNIVMEKYLPGYGGARRRLHVTKVRGADFRDGYHDYEIAQEGVVVHPRLIAGRAPRAIRADALAQRCREPRRDVARRPTGRHHHAFAGTSRRWQIDGRDAICRQRFDSRAKSGGFHIRRSH